MMEVEVPLNEEQSLLDDSDVLNQAAEQENKEETTKKLRIETNEIEPSIDNRVIFPIFKEGGRNDRDRILGFTMGKKINSIKKTVKVKKKVMSKRKEQNIKEAEESEDEQPLNDTIDTFLSSQNDFNKSQLKGHNLRYDRSGSPLKRNLIGSVEIFEKEKYKRTTLLPSPNSSKIENSLIQGEIFKSRLDMISKSKSKAPEKKGEKVPSFIMTKFSDSDLK